MGNNFSKEEIKNSVECQWRKILAKQLFSIYLIVLIASLFIPFIITVKYDIKYLGIVFIIWLCCMLVIGIFFGCFILYYVIKYKYLLKNYEKFDTYEVVLDTLSTSYAYKASIYYTVTFVYEGKTKRIDTNPYFSSAFFSKFSPEDYNNKKVIGLYDNNLEKFYIIKKVD